MDGWTDRQTAASSSFFSNFNKKPILLFGSYSKCDDAGGLGFMSSSYQQ
jgi:hypothetical protein